MRRNNYTSILNELSASERVFTTAQAERLGVPRNVLAKACERGRLVRVLHGAYRMAGVPASEMDELQALWKSTNPAAFTYERARRDAWDGICIGGSTAASVHGVGDFHLSPYRLFAPRRIRTRVEGATFGVRQIERSDADFSRGFPVTRLERTLLDLALDKEDPSLVANALADAQDMGLDEDHLAKIAGGESIVAQAYSRILHEGMGGDGI